MADGRYNIHNMDMPEDERQFGLALAEQLIVVERENLIKLLAMDLDDGHPWDETIMRGLVATQIFVGALASTIRLRLGDEADWELEKCRMSAVALLESTGGVQKSVEIVLNNLRAHEAGKVEKS
jgi:hypothetical protein